MWTAHEAYFARSGVDAWSSGEVPDLITTSRVLAEAYARVIEAYLAGCAEGRFGPFDPSEPVYLVELGAGSGRLGFHMVKRWVDSPPPVRVVYVLTDMADANVAFWRSHLSLRPFIDAGALDTALFNPVVDLTLHCERSGVVLRPGSVTNPVVAIANYLFCVQRQDLFVTERGVMCEELVGMYSSSGTMDDLREPGFVGSLSWSTERVPVNPGRYGDSEMDSLLREIVRTGTSVGSHGAGAPTRVLFPIDAVRTARTLFEISGERLLWLVGERPGNPDSRDRFLDMGIHGDSISLPVDLSILGRFAERCGASLIRPGIRNDRLEVAAIVGGAGGDGLARLRRELQEVFSEDPVGRVASAASRFSEDPVGRVAPPLSPSDIVGFLEQVAYDSRFLSLVQPALERVLPDAAETERAEAIRGLKQVWEHHYPLDGGSDVAVLVAGLLATAGDYAGALAVIDHRTATANDPRSRYIAAVCHAALGDLVAAKQAIDQAGALDPGFASLRRDLR